jgi:hypothetical protein
MEALGVLAAAPSLEFYFRQIHCSSQAAWLMWAKGYAGFM